MKSSQSTREMDSGILHRVTSVAGSEDNRVYSVVFKGYNNTEQLKALPANYVYQAPPASSKRRLNKDEEDERERKKKKYEKKVEMTVTKVFLYDYVPCARFRVQFISDCNSFTTSSYNLPLIIPYFDDQMIELT
ncbi:hypothetical protein M422DRAFT_71976 [Sphaerobolus stellatus SS14]|uniref:Uncharacterized protein n=1 Tax=Sphaerobolus stellatus (strain SS14) TaxID=990650 RepID=A0A0C9UAN4_SPHS4|nr:hypothetical protein M422DRAFT_71976 [Sphaerobolus stellatus SS14]